jgi:hypothetical protein
VLRLRRAVARRHANMTTEDIPIHQHTGTR